MQYEPDNFKAYLKNCEIIYDKQKMNGRYQVGSGRVVAVTHDTPFIDDTVARKDGVKTYSDHDSNGSEVSAEQADRDLEEDEKVENVRFSERNAILYIDPEKKNR